MTSPRPARLIKPRTAGFATMLGYFLIALGSHNLYPFSTFDMYSGRPSPSSSRVLVRDARGGLGDVTEWLQWRCDRPPALGPSADSASTNDDVERSVAGWIAAHPGTSEAGEPMLLVRCTWSLESRGGLREEERPIASCRAAGAPGH